MRLYDRLEAHFGAESVFLDVKTLEPGSNWSDEIKAHGAGGSAFLALIGNSWLATLKERERATAGQPEDYVALELELALRRWRGKVIPVLVSRATMPDASKLPRPIRALAGIEAMPLRPPSFEEDATRLIVKLEEIALEPDCNGAPDGKVRTAGLAGPGVRDRQGPDHTSSERSAIPAPDGSHYEAVLRNMLKGSVVPVLGAGVRGTLPDAKQLAAHLAQRFGVGSESLDLAEIAQRVAVAEGPSFSTKRWKRRSRPNPSRTICTGSWRGCLNTWKSSVLRSPTR